MDKLRLSDYGVKPEDAGELADNAASTMGARCSVVDPRTLSREEIMDIITGKHLSEYAESGPIGPLFFDNGSCYTFRAIAHVK